MYNIYRGRLLYEKTVAESLRYGTSYQGIATHAFINVEWTVGLPDFAFPAEAGHH